MKARLLMALIALIAPIFAAGLATGPGAKAAANDQVEAQRTQSYEIPANLAAATGGLSTHFELHPDDAVTISAYGRTTYGYEGSGDCAGLLPQVNPNGQRFAAGKNCGLKYDPMAAAPDAPIGSMIARVGNGRWFFVGTRKTFKPNHPGELNLAYNDSYYGDNDGVYRVTVTSELKRHPVPLTPAKYYAAFAYAIAERVAVVDSGTTADEARAAAESRCQRSGGGVDCQAVGWFSDGWGSFALGPGNQWYWSYSSSQATADKTALQKCGNGCQLTIRVGIGGPTPASADGTPVHGNWNVAGYTEGVGDHVGRDYWAVDFKSDATAVYPTRPGRVVYQGYNCETVPPGGSKCYGNVVVIDHGNGMYSIYSHLLATGLPAEGSEVTPSTQIGVMSDSGCAGCGIHLHYAMHQGKAGLTGRLALYDPSLKAVRTPWRVGAPAS